MVVALALTVAACATPIGVKRIGPAAAERSPTANVLTTGHPSAASMWFLGRLALEQRFGKEPAASELVVRSAHSCQSDPRTIGEVRRILYEQLEEER